MLKATGDGGGTPTPRNNSATKHTLKGDVQQYGTDTKHLYAAEQGASHNGQLDGVVNGAVLHAAKKVTQDSAHIQADLSTPQGQQAVEAYKHFQKDSQLPPPTLGLFNNGTIQSALKVAADRANFNVASGGANLQYFTEYMNANSGNNPIREIHVVDKSGDGPSIGEESVKINKKKE